MKLLSIKTRVTLGMVCLSVCVLVIAMALGLIPDGEKAVVQERIALCQTYGLHSSLLASQFDRSGAEELLQLLVSSRSDVISAGIRRNDGRLWVEAGDHAQNWSLPPENDSTDTQIVIPFVGDNRRWGHLEINFQPLRKAEGLEQMFPPNLRLIAFFAAACGLLFTIVFNRVLRVLDPSSSVPTRVRSALDTLAEGLLVLDQNERIVFANRAFADILGISIQELIGRRASALAWDNQSSSGPYPWQLAFREGKPRTGAILKLLSPATDSHTFVVNSAPIRNPENSVLGVVVCFEDVTPLERERIELKKTML